MVRRWFSSLPQIRVTPARTAKAHSSSLPSQPRVRPRVSIDPPSDASPPPPAWMTRYFPEYFQHDPSPGPEEHGQPLGAAGVYGYIATCVITAGLACAYLYERFVIDEQQHVLDAVKEARIRNKQ